MQVLAGVVAIGIVFAAPLGAQSAYQAFGPKPKTKLVAPTFTDQDVVTLLATLDRLLAADSASDGSSDDATTVLGQFARRIQAARLTKSQEARVLSHLDRFASSRPDAAAAVKGPRRMISELSVGKKAPEITGADLDGKPLKLSDFRNKVVVLAFSAEWCGICRAQEPYERFLTERYERWPFAMLGVYTGSSRESGRATAARGPAHRSWWDEPRAAESGGLIAEAWNVQGYPASYVIDGDGIIQFVDLREEDLLKAVRQLVEAQADRNAASERPRTAK